MIQDLQTQWPNGIQHAQLNPRGEDAHAVTIRPDSQLFALLGETTVRVNSLHHQAIGQLGEGLSCTATANDGVIEAVEHPGSAFVLGVQWHPESMAVHGNAPMNRLFGAFIAAAVKRLKTVAADERILG